MQRFSFFKPAASLVLIYSVWFLVAEVQAQTQETTTANNAMTKGAWAMQFQINQDFTLSSFKGATLSLKRHYSPSRALRFGLNLGGSFSNSEERRANNTNVESDRNNQSIGLVSEYVFSSSSEKSAKLFFGVGSSLGFSRSSQTQPILISQSQTREKNVTQDWSAGIIGVIGVEWFANAHISLLAEYSSFLGYSSYRRKLIYEQQDSNGGFVVTGESWLNIDSFSFSARSVNFGLSVYF